MRLAGITLTLLGLAAMVWFSVLTGPDPEIRCGTDSNLVVAWNGYDSFPERPAQRECRRLAVVDLAKGAALGTPLILAGIALIIAGGQRRTDRFEPAEVPTGRRSEDGTSWWDGYRWHPIAPESAGSPPAR